ncbi:MAG: hypothetical protein QS98_C0009G0014 [archaeon GW2011_AR3]|nr:MAG: hypothetical protein QS98_C0009G0014 [archaeon GW2011_AR3]MBS3110318.1 hypothetical protein [Candidatus Woesearchaeota archaeon]
MKNKIAQGYAGRAIAPQTRQEINTAPIISTIISIMLAFSILFVLNAGASSGLLYTIDTFCNSEPCAAGQNTTWIVTVTNEGVSSLELTSFELIDFHTTYSVAQYVYHGQPTSIYSEAPGGIKINPGKNSTFNLSGIMPLPIEYRKVIVFPCFGLATKQGDLYYQPRDIHEVRYCSKVNYSMFVVPCVNDNHCSEDQVCNANLCEEFGCADCEYLANHTCRAYECCSSNQCNDGEYCHDNNCLALKCQEDEAYSNHSCMPLRCLDSQYLYNHTCLDLKCEEDEGYVDHRCAQITCAENEYLRDHRCLKLDCTIYQGYRNHTCYELNCKEDEEFLNHTCQKLNCYFFQDEISHQCVNNNSSIMKAVAEAVVIILIILFLVVDAFKIEKKLHYR